MKIRRVVAGIGADGKSKLIEDGIAPRSVDFTSVPGFAATMLWSRGVGNDLPISSDIVDRTSEVGFAPAEGESRLLICTFPPDSVLTRADVDLAAFGGELARLLPGMAETFEPENLGMHTSNSVDYDVVLDGEITLELDDGKEVLLHRHDVIVQHGNRHAWRNRTDQIATMLFVLLGVKRPR